MKPWFARLTGRGDDPTNRLKHLLASYGPYRVPHSGYGHSLTIEQATDNLDFLLQHKSERLTLIGALLAEFGIDLPGALRSNDPAPFLDALWQWTASDWPSIYVPALALSARFYASRREGTEIVFSLIGDVALALGELVLVRRDDYRWALDLDPNNRGATEADTMVSWQRPVLLRPDDGIVPAILFDFEDIVQGAYNHCIKPEYVFMRDSFRCVPDALSGAHEHFWRDEAARKQRGMPFKESFDC